MRFIYTKSFIIFSACTVLLAFFLFLQVKGWLDPVRNVFLQAPRPVVYLVRNTTAPVRNFFSTIYHLHRLVDENAALTKKVYGLEHDLVLLDQTQKENEALRKELGFAKNFSQQLIPCSVISKNPFGFTDSFVMDCGQDRGVVEGLAVVSQGYLVGKVVYSSKNSSTALLVTSSRFSTDARLSKTGKEAVARGSFGSGIVLDQLSQGDAVEKGWLVVTAGINEMVPKDILIGEVGDVISDPGDLFKKATLLSPMDFNNLDFVFVVKAN